MQNKFNIVNNIITTSSDLKKATKFFNLISILNKLNASKDQLVSNSFFSVMMIPNPNLFQI